MNLELEDGRILEIENTGDCVSFTLWDSNEDIDDQIVYEKDTLVDLIFDMWVNRNFIWRIYKWKYK